MQKMKTGNQRGDVRQLLPPFRKHLDFSVDFVSDEVLNQQSGKTCVTFRRRLHRCSSEGMRERRKPAGGGHQTGAVTLSWQPEKSRSDEARVHKD